MAAALCTTTGLAKDAPRLHYLKVGHPDAAELLAPPPLPDSSEQAADLALVVSVAKSCSSNDMAMGFAEKKFSLFNFAPALGPRLAPGKFPHTEALLKRVQQEAELVADAAKEIWQRPRPYTLEPSLAAGKLEKSFSYPSGHSTEAMTVALVLAEVFPERREALLQIGRDIGWHRVCIGRHYLTDINAGRVLAQAIVRELKASPAFQKDLAKARAEAAAIQASN